MTYIAVQYRDMHSGIHHMSILTDKDKAQELYDYITENGSFPGVFALHLYPIVDDFEIDYRDPPILYNDEILDIITSHSDGRYDEHPDCY